MPSTCKLSSQFGCPLCRACRHFCGPAYGKPTRFLSEPCAMPAKHNKPVLDSFSYWWFSSACGSRAQPDARRCFRECVTSSPGAARGSTRCCRPARPCPNSPPAGGVRGGSLRATRSAGSCRDAWHANMPTRSTRPPRPYQFALQTRAGADALAGMLRAAVDLDADATIVSLDGRSAYDTISRAAFLRKLREVAPALWRPSEHPSRAKAASRATPWPRPCTRLANTMPSLLPTSCRSVQAQATHC